MSQGENAADTVNQQGSPTDTELAWLAGLWDGDGWIGITKAKRSRTKKNRYSASCTLSTTSDRLAYKAIDVMTRMGCPPTTVHKHRALKKSTWTGADVWHREKWDITIRSNKSMKVFLAAVGPLLVEKGVLAALVMRYVAWRESIPTQMHGTLAGMITQEAEGIISLLHADRSRNDPPEAIRSASKDEDMVRSA